MFYPNKLKIQTALLGLALILAMGAVALWYSGAQANVPPALNQVDPPPTAEPLPDDQATPTDPDVPEPEDGTVITDTVAAPESVCYTLTRQVDPEGGGKIRANPAPNCSNGRYLSGTQVRLTAEPESGSSFLYWTGDVTGSTNPVKITMKANKTVTAHFTQGCYNLKRTINPAGAGAISLYPLPNCANGTLYLPGTVVQVQATPVLGYAFSSWSGDVTGIVNPILITMNRSKSLTANFSLQCFTLSTVISPSGAGSISLSPAPNCDSNTKYTYGSVVSLTANAAPGYLFKSWSGDASGFANPTAVSINGNKSVLANFEYPVPVITQISPDMILAGGGNFTLSVAGNNFNSLSKVRWNGSDLTTQYINSQLLEAVVPAANIASTGTASITVFTPSPGGGISAPAGLSVGSNNPTPILTGFFPGSLPAHSMDAPLKVLGRNFATGVQIAWDGNLLPTTFVKSTEIITTVPGQYLTQVGVAQIVVTNPAPGGGNSPSTPYYVNHFYYLPLVGR